MTGRNQSLDVLRCIAILLVIGDHMKLYPGWRQFGWIGVDLFFVLSGFLVSGLLFAEYKATGQIDIRRFILRRGFKIWPSFYAFMAVIGVLIYHGSTIQWKAFLLTGAFLLNYLNVPIANATYHLWSLAVEEHFYLLLPLVMLALLRYRRSLDWIPQIFAFIAVTCLLLRIFTHPAGTGVFARTHLRIDSLFAGVFIGYLFHMKHEAFMRIAHWKPLPLLGVVCLSPLLFVPHKSFLMASFGLSLMWVGFACIVAWSVVREFRNPILKRVAAGMAYVGRHSYSIYLWHLPIALVIVGATLPSFLAGFVVCIAVGIVISKLIEMPALRIRDRIVPSSSHLVQREVHVGMVRIDSVVLESQRV